MPVLEIVSASRRKDTVIHCSPAASWGRRLFAASSAYRMPPLRSGPAAGERPGWHH